MQRYEVLRKIGKGSFGTVDLVRRRADHKSFVLKRMKIGSVSSKEREMCHNEVQLLERLNHPSIVRYEESFIHTKHCETYLCVVMTYCDGGDLTYFLKNQRGKKLREKHVLDLFVQIALALHFIHHRNILHRDLKAQNIFVKDGQLKLGDFGISKVLTGSVAFAQTMIGTPYYMSPEVFKGKPYNFKSDIWSLGCVLYELITFKHCFDANNLNCLAQKIVRGKYLPITSNQYRNELKILCYSMLNQLPSSRPTLSEILKHKLLQNRIRDFYISCYKKFKQNIITQSTFNNLKNQLFEIGLTHILDNIDHIAKQQSLKKQQQKKLIQEQKSIEKEKKIQKDMEDALEKLKIERKWRAAQKKQRQKMLNKYDHDGIKQNYNFGGKKRQRVRSYIDHQNIADKRRMAAKHRKLQILKQQEQKRQELAAKHRNKQQRAAKRKNIEMNRKNPYSQRRSPNNHKLKAKIKNNKSPKKKKEEEQVEQLNMWENAHFVNNNNNNNNNNAKQPRRSIVKQQNLVLVPDIEPQYHNKAALPSKSPLSLLQQKMKYQKEYDALEGLKKRRELIQKRLNEISERHRQRQLKKQNRHNIYNNNNYNHSSQQNKRRQTKSEQPFISNSIQTKKIKNINNQQTAMSQQSTPYRKRPQLRGNRIPFASPNKTKTNNITKTPPTNKYNNNNNNAMQISSASPSPSPLKYAGTNVIHSNPSSKVSSVSVSPESEHNSNMNPRERMKARKRARADLRAKQLKVAHKQQYEKNQLQAQHNKHTVSGSNTTKMTRAVSLETFDEVMVDESSGGGTMSEPPFLSSTINTINGNNMNEFPRAIMTIQERTEEMASDGDGDDEDEDEDDNDEEDMIQEEIEELKQTLVEHTMQIEEIKNTILLKRKEQLSDSDNDNDHDVNDDDDDDDVETLLNKQEETMKTMRLQQDNNNNNNNNKMQQEQIVNNNNNNNGIYKEIESPNNIDVTYHERHINNNNDDDVDEESDESSEEMPIGRLSDRIEYIKRKCIEGMGLDGFKIAYNLMKQIQYEDKNELVLAINNKIKQLCNNPNVSKSRIQKYRSLIDQLLFIEANCS